MREAAASLPLSYTSHQVTLQTKHTRAPCPHSCATRCHNPTRQPAYSAFNFSTSDVTEEIAVNHRIGWLITKSSAVCDPASQDWERQRAGKRSVIFGRCFVERSGKPSNFLSAGSGLICRKRVGDTGRLVALDVSAAYLSSPSRHQCWEYRSNQIDTTVQPFLLTWPSSNMVSF